MKRVCSFVFVFVWLLAGCGGGDGTGSDGGQGVNDEADARRVTHLIAEAVWNGVLSRMPETFNGDYAPEGCEDSTRSNCFLLGGVGSWEKIAWDSTGTCYKRNLQADIGFRNYVVQSGNTTVTFRSGILGVDEETYDGLIHCTQGQSGSTYIQTQVFYPQHTPSTEGLDVLVVADGKTVHDGWVTFRSGLDSEQNPVDGEGVFWLSANGHKFSW